MERNTEALVESTLKIKIGTQNGITTYAQAFPEKYKNKITSKSGKSKNGRPEFVITNKQFPNNILIVECKANMNQQEDAVKEVQHYMKETFNETPDINVYGIAFSGQEENKTLYELFVLQNGEIKSLTTKHLTYKEIVDKFLTDKTTYIKENELNELMGTLNKEFHSIGFSAKDRAIVLSALLSALQIKTFAQRLSTYEEDGILLLKNDILSSSEEFFSQQDLEKTKIRQIEEQFRYTLDKYDGLSVEKLISILNKLYESPILINAYQKNSEGLDILGKFFNGFLRYGSSDSKGLGQVLTPDHIAELFTELTNDGKGLDLHNQVIDITCGTGAFLVQALTKLFALADTEEDRQNVRKFGVWGNERDAELTHLAILNNIMHGDGKANIVTRDALEVHKLKNILHSKGAKISHALINPPYFVPNSIPPELTFAYNAAELTQPGGEVIMIAPVSVLLGSKYAAERQLMMKHHTLKATFIMPKELFQPYAGVETAVSIWETHRPHRLNDKVYTANWENDGFVKQKNKGRQDIKNLWNGIKQEWLEMYREKKVIPGKSAYVSMTHTDEWTLYPYVETDYSNLTVEDFSKTIRSFLAFEMENGNE